MIDIFIYILGGLIVVLSFLNFLFPKRTISLIIKASLDALTILYLTLILASTNETTVLAGVVTNAIGFTRDVVFYNRNKYKALNSFVWPLIYCILFAGSLIFTYKGLISIIPVIGSLFSTSTLFANDQRITKGGAIIATSCYLTYYLLLLDGSGLMTIFSVLSSLTCLIGSAIGLIVLLVKNKKN